MSSVKGKRRLFEAGIFLSLLTGIGGIGAMLLDTDSAVNTMRVGSITSEIVEDFTPPESVSPGTIIHKAVTVMNTGTAPAYVRTMVLPSDLQVWQQCSVNWNLEDWFEGDDHYYYYRRVLQPGEQTPCLMSDIITYENTDTSGDFDLIVRHESVQANMVDIQKYWGSGVSIDASGNLQKTGG